MTSRPGWRLMSMQSAGSNQHGDRVIEFDSVVLVQAA
jgi:acyl dehydratase